MSPIVLKILLELTYSMYIRDTRAELESVPIVGEFPEVFLIDIPSIILYGRDIDFDINFVIVNLFLFHHIK